MDWIDGLWHRSIQNGNEDVNNLYGSLNWKQNLKNMYEINNSNAFEKIWVMCVTGGKFQKCKFYDTAVRQSKVIVLGCSKPDFGVLKWVSRTVAQAINHTSKV